MTGDIDPRTVRGGRRLAPSEWTLSARVTALCAAVGLLLGLIALGAATAAIDNRHELDDVFGRIGPLRTNGDALLAAVLDQETGIRGYAVNGTDADLAPYDAGRAQESTLVPQMLSQAHDQPEIQSQIRLVSREMGDWRSAVAQPVIARVQGGDRDGAQALLDAAARTRFDRVRDAIGTLQARILAVRNAAVAHLQANADQVVRLLVIAALVVLGAGLLLALLLRYLVTQPVRRLAHEVRRVADGDYDHVVERSGPPEVRSLGQGVEEMRRKIVSDLGEVRNAQAQIESAHRQLEEQASELARSNRDLEQFAYVASHDLQEPLRKVASFCQLLQRRYAGKLDERGDQYIAFAVDGAQRMQRLINDLLAFSRIGRLTSGFTKVDLGAVAAEVVSQREVVLEETGGEILVGDLPVVEGEEALLTALLGNLVGNSLKFRRPDRPPRIELSARRLGAEWEISCTDNGIGIEPEFADKVFVIFQRLHAKDAYPGTGIGLAIAKKIVEYHSGRIWIDTGQSSGTTIRFTLPVTVTAADAAPLPGAAPQTVPAKEPVA